MGQIPHFANEGVNVFRLGFSWMYMQPELRGPLNESYFALNDKYVQKCIEQGAHVIIDPHDYARRDGDIVGQSKVTDEDFADFWTKLAGRYANESKVIFSITNEPHDLNIKRWAETAQKIVHSIRKVAPLNQPILIPGDNFTSLYQFPKWVHAMKNVSNPDGSFDNLIFDIHGYMDPTWSGLLPNCTHDLQKEIKAVQQTLADLNRTAFLTEIGGGNNEGCAIMLNDFLKTFSKYPDQFVGFTIWSAGAFQPSFPVQVTPVGEVDSLLWEKGVRPYLQKENSASSNSTLSEPKVAANHTETLPKPNHTETLPKPNHTETEPKQSHGVEKRGYPISRSIGSQSKIVNTVKIPN